MAATCCRPSNGRYAAFQSAAPKDGGSFALTLVGREGAAADQVIAAFGELDLGVGHAVVSPAGAPIVSSVNSVGNSWRKIYFVFSHSL